MEPRISQPRGADGVGHGTGRSRRALVKKRKVACAYALGEDIRWTQILQMVSFTMVGKKNFKKNCSMIVIENWIKNSWAEELGEVPELEGLTQGWFALNFSQLAHVNWVLARNWSLEQCPVLLKMWTPTFDTSCEWVDVFPIWVRLSSLPRQYWLEDHFISIGNIWGPFWRLISPSRLQKFEGWRGFWLTSM